MAFFFGIITSLIERVANYFKNISPEAEPFTFRISYIPPQNDKKCFFNSLARKFDTSDGYVSGRLQQYFVL